MAAAAAATPSRPLHRIARAKNNSTGRRATKEIGGRGAGKGDGRKKEAEETGRDGEGGTSEAAQKGGRRHDTRLVVEACGVPSRGVGERANSCRKALAQSASQVSPSRPPREYTSVRPPSTACVGKGNTHWGRVRARASRRVCECKRATDICPYGKETKAVTRRPTRPTSPVAPTTP